MIVSIIENEEPIVGVLQSERKHQNLILNASELTTLEEMRDILAPFKQLTVAVSSKRNVTVSLIAPSIHNLLSRQLAHKEEDSEFIQNMKE